MYAEKFYTAGVIRIYVFLQSTGPIIGISEPTYTRFYVIIHIHNTFEAFTINIWFIKFLLYDYKTFHF